MSFTIFHSELHFFLVIKLELPNKSKKWVPDFHREDGEEEEEGAVSYVVKLISVLCFSSCVTLPQNSKWAGQYGSVGLFLS